MAPRYRYRHFSKLPPDFLKKKATEVLYEKMIFYDTKAKQLYSEIKKVLKSSDAAQRGDILAQMTKYIQRANDICIECAAKLAPYQSPRLQSMEVKKQTTVRFVIQAPKPAQDSNSWLESASESTKLISHPSAERVIQHEEQLNGHSSSGPSPV